MRKIWDIPGGVHPPENKHQSTQTPIKKIDLPSHVVLPLNQHIGAPAIPIVNIGDSVLTGQKIADAQGFVSAPVHASLSGTVVAIEERPIPHASGRLAPCIVIESDGKDTWVERKENSDYLSQEKLTLAEKIREAGIAGMGGAGFPTAVKMQPHANMPIDTLILNGTECEPYITADDMLMRERAEDIVLGAQLLAHILGKVKTILIGIEDNKPEAIASVKKAVSEFSFAESNAPEIDVVSFPTKYPSGGEKQLIQILTGKEVPSGGIPAQLGIVVQNVGTAVAAYRAVRFGEPLVSRITTVVGESVGQQQNIEVRLGTPIEHVLNVCDFNAEHCARLIIGGPMMGYSMTRHDIPVVKTTNCILVPSHSEMPEQPPAQPCIRCGMCAEACPANLLPQQLFWFAQAEEVEKLQSHNLFDCIECGACSYVCPSNIPLVQYYRASKGIIRKIESDKHKSDRSRERFEFRQARIEKAEAEKEAKRLARKKAAEEAKKKLEEQKAAGGTQSAATPATTPEAKSTNDDPAVQQAKLERAVTSAQSRVERAQKQLDAAVNGEEGVDNSEARIETLKAKLKQAELKLNEAKQKRDDAGTPSAKAGAAPAAKLALSPIEKSEKNIETLKKRLAKAEEKFSEAEQSGSPTTDALKQGVEKLQAKLADAEKELTELKANNSEEPSKKNDVDAATQSAADIAIAKAQAKAAELASMSDDEKAQAQIDSLKSRLEKAQQRLAKAEEENSEHIDAFRAGVEKLEKKLQEINT